jgi:hypothetical protein
MFLNISGSLFALIQDFKYLVSIGENINYLVTYGRSEGYTELEISTALGSSGFNQGEINTALGLVPGATPAPVVSESTNIPLLTAINPPPPADLVDLAPKVLTVLIIAAGIFILLNQKVKPSEAYI